MSNWKIILSGLIALIIIRFAMLSFSTRHSPVKPGANRTLVDCPDKKNCVSSLSIAPDKKVDAFDITAENAANNWQRLIRIVQQQGGEILFNDGKYCHAVFTSMIFRFKDDLELLMDQSQIQIRSASRAGYSDFGVNRKRIEKIRSLLLEPDQAESIAG
jgi:uncharacterized protein (DUF1499 family)